MQKFVDELSNWYVRRSRRRLWKSQSDRDKLAGYQTLYETLSTVSRLMDPFVPFMAEALYRNLADGKTVHRSDFPRAMQWHAGESACSIAHARPAAFSPAPSRRTPTTSRSRPCP